MPSSFPEERGHVLAKEMLDELVAAEGFLVGWGNEVLVPTVVEKPASWTEVRLSGRECNVERAHDIGDIDTRTEVSEVED